MNKKRLLPLLMGLFFLMSNFLPLVTVFAEETDFQIEATAALSVDVETGKIFYNQNGDEKMGIASITKLISIYLVEKEVAEGRLSWDEEITIDEEVAALSTHPLLSNVPLYPEFTYTVQELYDSTMIQSANASIMALAIRIAGSEAAFVDMMKAQLAKWGIQDAQIVNSSGLNNEYLTTLYPGSQEDDENLLTARELAIVARHLIQDFPHILDVAATHTKVFGEHTYSPVEMENWNWLLPESHFPKDGVDGLKTGTTDLAGACFVGTMTKDGQRIITVVLNATNHEDDLAARFTETARLMDYSYDNWRQEEIIAAGDTVPDFPVAPVHEGKEPSVPVIAAQVLTAWLPTSVDSETLTFTVELMENLLTDGELQAPIAQGTSVGTFEVNLDDSLGYLEEDDQTTLMGAIQTTQEVERVNFFVRLYRSLYTTVSGWFN